MQVHIDLTGGGGLSRDIYEQLRDAILDGRLRPRERLPATRELARDLDVSRTTVTVAYHRLAGEGFVTARVGAGTFVSERVASPLPSPGTGRGGAGVLEPRSIWDPIVVPTPFDRPARFDFRTGLPDASLFPHVTWRRLMGRESRSEQESGNGAYRHPAGHPELRAAIARHVGVARGVKASADDVVITNGTQQAIDLIARVLASPGDRVVVEDPGYPPPRQLLRTLGLRVVGVAVDREGLVVGEIPSTARLVYVTPSHQYPLGVAMSLPRRLSLLAWAEENDAAILEDDYDSEFRLGGPPIDPLATLDQNGRVVYVGSFSKTMSPTLRLGFIVAPPSLRGALHKAKWVADWHTASLPQATMARFMDEGRFARHIRRVNRIYRERHEKVVGILRRDFEEYLELVPSAAGLHVTACARTLSAEGIRSIAVAASEAGVEVQRLSTFRVGDAVRPGLVLGYGAISTEDIAEGLDRLASCFESPAVLERDDPEPEREPPSAAG